MDDAPAKRIGDWFSRIANRAAELMGSASAFVIATVAVLLWAISGPLFGFSDTWQLIINTATTVLTFLAVFLIQHSQNRDARASQLKLDELIRSTKRARNRLIDLEHCSDEEMEELQEQFSREQKRRRRDEGASAKPAVRVQSGA